MIQVSGASCRERDLRVAASLCGERRCELPPRHSLYDRRMRLALALAVLGVAGCDCDDDAFATLVPAIAVDVDRVTFDDTYVGTTSGEVVTLSSVGSAPVHITAAELRGDDDSGAFGGGELAPGAVEAGGERRVSFAFQPRAPGTFSARFVVASDAENRPELEVTLQATALAPLDCDDDNPCTDERFDVVEGVCVRSNNADACDDGSACTDDDRCAAGACRGDAIVCVDDVGCTDDLCDPERGCVFVPDHSVCVDDDACSLDVCDPDGFFDGCTHPPAPDGTVCGDFVACTSIEVCVQRFCTSLPIPDGAPCSDGDVCTAGDVCDGGACTGVAAEAPPTVVRETHRFLGTPRGALVGRTLLWPDQFLRATELDDPDLLDVVHDRYGPDVTSTALARPVTVTRIDDTHAAVLVRSALAGRDDDAAFVHVVDAELVVVRSFGVRDDFRLLGADASHVYGCTASSSSQGTLVSLPVVPDPDGDDAPPVLNDPACDVARKSADGAGVVVVVSGFGTDVYVLDPAGSQHKARIETGVFPDQVLVGRHRTVLFGGSGLVVVNTDRADGDGVSPLVVPLLGAFPIAVGVDKLYVVDRGDADDCGLCDGSLDDEDCPCFEAGLGYRRLTFDADDTLTLDDDWHVDTPLLFDGRDPVNAKAIAVDDDNAVLVVVDGTVVVADVDGRVVPVAEAGAIDALVDGSDADPVVVGFSLNRSTPLPAALLDVDDSIDVATPGTAITSIAARCAPPVDCGGLRPAHLIEDRAGRRTLYAPRGPVLDVDANARTGLLPDGVRSDVTAAVVAPSGLADVLDLDDAGRTFAGVANRTSAHVEDPDDPARTLDLVTVSLADCTGAGLGHRFTLDPVVTPPEVFALSACLTEDPHAVVLGSVVVPELEDALSGPVSSWQTGSRVSFLAEGVAVLVDVENPLLPVVVAVVEDARFVGAEFFSAGSDLDAWVVVVTGGVGGSHVFVYDVGVAGSPRLQVDRELPSGSGGVAHRVLEVSWPRAFVGVWDGDDDVARGHFVGTWALAADVPFELERIAVASEPVDLKVVDGFVVVGRADGVTVVTPPCGAFVDGECPLFPDGTPNCSGPVGECTAASDDPACGPPPP